MKGEGHTWPTQENATHSLSYVRLCAIKHTSRCLIHHQKTEPNHGKPLRLTSSRSNVSPRPPKPCDPLHNPWNAIMNPGWKLRRIQPIPLSLLGEEPMKFKLVSPPLSCLRPSNLTHVSFEAEVRLGGESIDLPPGDVFWGISAYH